MMQKDTEIPGSYRIGDAREPLDQSVSVAFADLAWARPHRNGVHVTYETYSPENGLWDFVDAIYESLEQGGWAIFDADDWLLPRLIDYIREHWGDVAATYSGGGFRRIGGVHYESGGNGAGHYFTNGGYSVVFAHKGETDRETNVSARQSCPRVPSDVRQKVEWGTIKPIQPYRLWLDALTTSDNLVYIPCAGTAPAALACEQLYGESANFIAVDSEPQAKEAYLKRRSMQIESQQTTLTQS
jgi:hypothetical protein